MDRHYDHCPKCFGWKKKQSLYCRKCNPTYQRTPEHRQKMGVLKAGTSPRGYGWHHSEKTKEKMRSLWTPQKKKDALLRGLAMASNSAWRKKIGESVSGSKNPMWENGRSEIPYAPGWGRRHRKGVGPCERCGELKPLDTHHKDGSKSNHEEDNLAGLCRKCHKKAHAELRQMRKSRPD